MAGNVSVDEKAIAGRMRVCQMSVEKLEGAISQLKRDYEKAGSSGWRDSKYEQLGELVNSCINALKKPISELNECNEKLNILLEEVKNYEGINI